MSKILAIDTSHSHCSVAVNTGGKIDFLITTEPRQHARRLLPMIEELMARNAMQLVDLDAIAFVSGPGSFTGLRIGAGVAQGLALGAQIPVLGLSSMAVMALKASRYTQDKELLICMQARENELYSAAYRPQGDDVKLLGREHVGGIESIDFAALTAPEDAYLVGDALDLALHALAEEGAVAIQAYREACVSDAPTLSVLASTRFARGEGVEPALALPVYLKEQMDYQE
tara:strand:+ start:5160 stop:5846 length:687 start_codon:yes stop_codon:yes gene_type:complete